MMATLAVGGGLDSTECDADGGRQRRLWARLVEGCGCGMMNAVYDVQNGNEYMGCFEDGTDPIGVGFYGDAFNSAEYGVHLDGRGDYITVDPLSQQREWQENLYCDDGTFTISFWFWKRACTVAGSFEWLYSHNDNNEDIYNEPPADAVWTSVPLMIASEQERLDWIASDPDITDALCEECGTLPSSSRSTWTTATATSTSTAPCCLTWPGSTRTWYGTPGSRE